MTPHLPGEQAGLATGRTSCAATGGIAGGAGSSAAPLDPPPARTAQASRARLKHGLYSQHAVLPGESQAAFEDFRHDMIQEQQPVAPEEAGLVEQMVMAQWQLKRVWAIQTGVYLDYERAAPAEGDEPHPLRLAQCFVDDCANGRALDRMSMHQVRLVNIFHKCGRRLELLREQRRKGLAPGNVTLAEAPGVNPAGSQWAAQAEAALAPSDSKASGSGEIADRGRTAARAPAMVPGGPWGRARRAVFPAPVTQREERAGVIQVPSVLGDGEEG